MLGMWDHVGSGFLTTKCCLCQVVQIVLNFANLFREAMAASVVGEVPNEEEVGSY